MSNESRRDESVDRLLRTSMRDAVAGPTTACIEAETLAAWADGGLAARERERVEAHVSSCANCRSLVAAFARSMPETAGSAAATAPAAKWLSGWKLGWMLASVAVVGVVTFWVTLPGRLADQAQMRGDETQLVLRAPNPSPAAPAEAPTRSVESSAKAVEPAVRAQRQAAPSPLSRGEPATSAPAQQTVVPAAGAQAASPERPMLPPPPPASSGAARDAAPLVQAASGERSTTVARSQLENLPSPTGPADHNFLGYINIQPGVSGNNRIAGGGQSNYMLDGLSASDATLVAEIVPPPAVSAAFSTVSPSSVSAPGAAGGRGGGGGGRGAQAAPASAPAPSVTRWRILANGQVDRVTASAPQEQRAVFDPPVFVTAGSAPSALVCWLVGRGGAVVRTIDGEHFQSVAFPASTDLRSVTAASALQASVVTVSGDTYVTTDGGATWRRLP